MDLVVGGIGGIGSNPVADPPGSPVRDLEGLLAQVGRQVRQRYGTHPWVDDLVAEARLGAYQALVRTAGRGFRPEGVARRAGARAVAVWLRSAMNEQRSTSRKGGALPQVVPLGEEVRAEGDFAAGLVDRVAAAGLLAALARDPAISAVQIELIRRVTMAGEPVGEVARDLGIGVRRAFELRRQALRRLRRLAREAPKRESV